MEKKEDSTNSVDISDAHTVDVPEYDDAARAGSSVLHDMDERYKISISGKKLPVDENNVWIRRSKNWKPHEVPTEWWRRMPAMHDMWREMFPDPRKIPIEGDGSGDPRAMDAALRLYGEEVVTAVGDEVDRIEKALVRVEPSIHYVDLETN